MNELTPESVRKALLKFKREDRAIQMLVIAILAVLGVAGLAGLYFVEKAAMNEGRALALLYTLPAFVAVAFVERFRAMLKSDNLLMQAIGQLAFFVMLVPALFGAGLIINPQDSSGATFCFALVTTAGFFFKFDGSLGSVVAATIGGIATFIAFNFYHNDWLGIVGVGALLSAFAAIERIGQLHKEQKKAKENQADVASAAAALCAAGAGKGDS